MESINGDNDDVRIVHVKDGARDLDMSYGTDTMCEEIDQENIGTESDDSSVHGENTNPFKGCETVYYRNCPETPYLHKGKLSVTSQVN